MAITKHSWFLILVATGYFIPTTASAFVLNFNGTLNLNPSAGSTPSVSNFNGNIDILSASNGIATFNPVNFFGQTLSFHDVNMSSFKLGPTNVTGQFDWGSTINTPFSLQWDVTGNNNGGFTMTTVDNNGDGIPGTPMLSGPFVGKSFAIDGIASPVPLPAAIWLFGTGLAGLFGMTVSRQRRRISL